MVQVAPTPTAVAVQRTKPNENFHKSMKLIIIIANCMGLLPVNGVTADSPDKLHFKWVSLKTFYTFVLLFLCFFINIAVLFIMEETDFSNYVMGKLKYLIVTNLKHCF